jgi:hypothetical protein
LRKSKIDKILSINRQSIIKEARRAIRRMRRDNVTDTYKKTSYYIHTIFDLDYDTLNQRDIFDVKETKEIFRLVKKAGLLPK